jgi:serine/threonine-protein kinase
MGRVFMKTGDYVDAEARFKASVEARPGNWRGYDLLGYFMLSQGRLDEAAASYERVIELSPDNASGYNSLGAVYLMKGDFKLAAESFRRSLEIAPSRGALSNTGTVYYFAGDFEQAAELFQKAAEEVGTDYRLWGNLADALRFVEGRKDEAKALYRRSIEMAAREVAVTGEDGASLSNLAWYHANLAEEDRARAYLEKLDSGYTLDAQQHYVVALTWALLGEADRADAAILEAISLGIPQAIVESAPEFRRIGINPNADT